MSRIVDIRDFKKASSGSIIRLLPLADGTHPFYTDHDLLVVAVDAVATGAPLHLSGPSGTGKSHFLNSLFYGPRENFRTVVQSLGLPRWNDVKVHRLFVSCFETPAEVWYKTEVVDFSTEERPQRILEILRSAANDPKSLHVVWLVESGRGITASVQGAFLELVGQRTVREPRGQTFETSNISFVTDSNHVANEAGEFIIFDLDQAYGRRWTRRQTLSAFTPDQEAMILRELARGAGEQQIRQVVALATAIRQKHSEGDLASILPPTIDVELDLLGAMGRLPVSMRYLVFGTLLGHCAVRDMEDAHAVFAEAFGVRVEADTPAAEAVGVL